MLLRSGILAVGVQAAAVLVAGAQTRPDLSGHWQATRETPSTVAAAPSPVFGEQFAMKHDHSVVELSRPVRDRPAPFVTSHRADGTESRIMLPGRSCLGQTGQVVKTAWDGNTLAYTVVGVIAAGSAAPTPSSLRYVFRLEGPDALVVESVMRTSASAAPTPVGTLYRRMPPTGSLAALPEPVVTGTPAAVGAVAWIAGNWSGTLGTATVEERWTTAAGGAMIAMSRTIRNGVMTEFEFLCIAERDGSLVYSAMPNAVPPTHFLLTSLEGQSATFENASNDFPKKIQYVLKSDGTLEATISGAPPRRPVTFVFRRQP